MESLSNMHLLMTTIAFHPQEIFRGNSKHGRLDQIFAMPGISVDPMMKVVVEPICALSFNKHTLA